MAEAMTFEHLVAFSVLAMSVLSLVGSLIAVRSAQATPQRKIDLAPVVDKAPYHRLHNIVTVRQR